jgi:hypothetical protein
MTPAEDDCGACLDIEDSYTEIEAIVYLQFDRALRGGDSTIGPKDLGQLSLLDRGSTDQSPCPQMALRT